MAGKAVILADDLTGAGDVGAECLRNSWRVKCVFAHTAGPGAAGGERAGEITVMDLETRRMGLGLALKRAGETARSLAARGACITYFKIDSTLRGHFIEEAEAIRRATGKRLAWIVPANPAMGRWTIGGRHFVGGEPIERSSFGRDPLHPIRSGDLLKAAARRLGGGRTCAHLRLSQLRGGMIAPLRRMWLKNGARAVVADAVTESDLRSIAKGISGEDLPCGAAPLARFLVGRPRRAAPRAKTEPPSARICGLGVFGSLNPVTGRQLRRAARHPRVRVKWLGPRDILRPRKSALSNVNGWLVLALSAERFKFRCRKRTGAGVSEGEKTARALARYAGALARDREPTDLLVSGGLTAAAVCEELGIDELELAREISPGLMMSLARSPERTFRLVTKPGGFGGPDSLLEMMGRRRNPGRGAA